MHIVHVTVVPCGSPTNFTPGIRVYTETFPGAGLVPWRQPIARRQQDVHVYFEWQAQPGDEHHRSASHGKVFREPAGPFPQRNTTRKWPAGSIPPAICKSTPTVPPTDFFTSPRLYPAGAHPSHPLKISPATVQISNPVKTTPTKEQDCTELNNLPDNHSMSNESTATPKETLPSDNTDETASQAYSQICSMARPPPGLEYAMEGRHVGTAEGGSSSEVDYEYDIPGMSEEAMAQFAVTWNGEDGAFLGRLAGRGADGQDEMDFYFVDQGILRFSDLEARRIATRLYAPDRKRMKARSKRKEKRERDKATGRGKLKYESRLGGAAQAEQAPPGAGMW